jgi:hypothetical protein
MRLKKVLAALAILPLVSLSLFIIGYVVLGAPEILLLIVVALVILPLFIWGVKALAE